MFSNILDILELLPHYYEQSNGEYHTPCPFCNSGTPITYKNRKFYGDDRLVWFADGRGAYCRQEETYYPIHKIAAFFGGEISEDFDMLSEGAVESSKNEPPVVASSEYVQKCHENADRSYWYQNGWWDEAIDRFRLGKGGLYPFSTRAERHLIPMQCQHEGDAPIEGYSFEGRLVDPAIEEPRNVKTKGLTKGWFWYVKDDPDSDTLAVAEGPKDAITLWINGYRNFAAIFGSGGFTPGIARFLKSEGYRTVMVFGDNDEAGEKFNRSVVRHMAPTRTLVMNWPDFLPEKYDVTDAHRAGNLKRLIEEYCLEKRNKGLIPDYTAVDPDYVPAEPDESMSRDRVRQELPQVVTDFLDSYKERKKFYGRGVLKLLAAPPGAGKSYTLVAEAQRRARLVLEQRKKNVRKLEQKIAELEAILVHDDLNDAEREGFEKAVERLKKRKLRVNRIVYSGPFIAGWDDIQKQAPFDPSLWYNYEARNESNCRNLKVVEEVAAKGYNARSFCEVSCPFKDWCEENGYLAQDKERESYPITYLRHQHLESPIIDGSSLILIDEEPFHVFEQEIVVQASELRPVYEKDWADFVEPEQVELVNELIAALRATLQDKDLEAQGYAVIAEIDKRSGYQLSNILRNLDPDVLEIFQPSSGVVIQDENDAKNLPQRCVLDLFEVLADELPEYEAGQRLYNTRLYLRKGKFHIIRIKQFQRPASHPIIVADATAMAPDLYGHLTGREVEVYRPEIWSPKAHTKVFYGSDFTRTNIRSQIGPALAMMDRYADDLTVYDIFGEPFDLSTIPVDENMYNSDILNQAMSLLKEIEARHESLLVVTYKPIRLLMERKVQQVYPDMRVRFAHYGSLRGTNIYKDYEAVLVIGCHRLPYDHLHRLAQAWARMAGYDQYIDASVVVKTAPYHGRLEGYTYYGFADEFANQFVELAEVGEIQQALDRIRLFTSDTDKYAYLALSRPAARWVGELESVYRFTNFARNTKHEEMAKYIAEYWDREEKAPTYKHLTEKFRVSRRDVRKVLEEVEHDRLERFKSRGKEREKA